jgi:hypothetical protein
MWHDALIDALPQWELAIRHSGWHPTLLALGYALVAVLCCAGGASAGRDGRYGSGWFVAAGILAAIAVNTVTRLDLLLIYALRAASREQGWYDARRAWQTMMIGALAVTGLLAMGWLRTRLAAVWSRCALAVLGMGLLAGLAATRAVSFHYTDLALGISVAGVSAGRLLEVAGLALTAAGAWRWSRSA